MKILSFALLVIVISAVALAQAPDPRDRVIIESKSVMAGIGAPGIVILKVEISNKDTLANFTLPLEIKTAFIDAFIVLGYPRTFAGTMNRLTSTLGNNLSFTPFINSASPDSAVWSAFWDPNDTTTAEPPNPFLKPFWELRFDSVRLSGGGVQIDSAVILNNRVGFTSIGGNPVNVNFTSGQVYVLEPHPCQITNCYPYGSNLLYGRSFTRDFDADQPGVIWSVRAGPGTIDPSTGVYAFSGQCPVGSLPVLIRGTGDRGVFCECEFTMNIIDNAPVCSPEQSVVTVSHGLVAMNQINASDPDAGDGVVYSILSGPGAVNASGVWSYTTGCEDVPVSPQTIRIKVSDAFGNCNPGPKADTCQFQLVVTNSPPVFTWPTSAPK